MPASAPPPVANGPALGPVGASDGQARPTLVEVRLATRPDDAQDLGREDHLDRFESGPDRLEIGVVVLPGSEQAPPEVDGLDRHHVDLCAEQEDASPSGLEPLA